MTKPIISPISNEYYTDKQRREEFKREIVDYDKISFRKRGKKFYLTISLKEYDIDHYELSKVVKKHYPHARLTSYGFCVGATFRLNDPPRLELY